MTGENERIDEESKEKHRQEWIEATYAVMGWWSSEQNREEINGQVVE